MKILLSFIGLQRTIMKTHENLKETLLNNKDEFTIIFVTWESENTEDFNNMFPDAIIHKIPDINFYNNPDFDKWTGNMTMNHHLISVIPDRKDAFYLYYRQTYLWYKTAKIIEEKYLHFDIVVKARPDCIIENNKINSFYHLIDDTSLFVPNEPKHAIVENYTCTDILFFATPHVMINLLNILHNVEYLHNKYNIPVHHETMLFLLAYDNKLQIKYMDNSAILIREHNIVPIDLWYKEKEEMAK